MPPCLRIPRDLYRNSYSETEFSKIHEILFPFFKIPPQCTFSSIVRVIFSCGLFLVSYLALVISSCIKSLVKETAVNSKFHPCLVSLSVLEDNTSWTWPKVQECILLDSLQSSLNWLCWLEWKSQYYNYTF